MTRLNIRLILILSASCLLLSTAVFFLQRWQVARHASGLLRRADLAEEAGETQKAVSLLGRYLQHRPQDGQAFARLALMLEESTQGRMLHRDEYHRTQQVLEKAIRLDPGNEQLRRRAFAFYLRCGRPKDAADHIRALLAEDSDDPQLQFLLARALLGGANTEAAAAELEKIVGYERRRDEFDARRATDSANIEAYELLAAIVREHRGQRPLADRIMEQCVLANERSAAAHLARGRYLLRNDAPTESEMKKAKADIRKAAELAPEDADVILAVAEVEIADGNHAAAKSWLDRGIDAFPDRPAFYRQRAKLALRTGDREDAARIVSAGRQRAPDHWPLLLMQAELDLAAGNLQRVEQAVTKLQSDERMRLLGDYLNAQVLFARRQWKPCAQATEALLPELMTQRPDLGPQAYLMLAQCCERMGQHDRQRAANQKLLELEPESFAGQFSEARALMRLGRLDEAEEALTVAKRLAQQQGVEAAELRKWEITLLAAQERRKPKADRDLSEIEARFLEELHAREDLSPEDLATAHVRFLMQQQELSRAAEVLEAALEESPRNATLLLAKVDLAQLQKGPQAAAKLLEDARAVAGDTVEIRLRQALLEVEQQSTDARQRLRQLEENTNHFRPAEKIRLWQGLAAIYRNLGDFDESLRLWRQVAAARPDDVAVRLNMFELARIDGDAEEMEKLSQEIRRLAGEGDAVAKFVEASRLLAAAEGRLNEDALAQAQQLVQEARQQRPNWHVLSRLQADLEIRRGNTDGAIEHLRAALDQGPASPPTVRKLVELLWSQRRVDEARLAMQRLAPAEATTTGDARFHSRAELAGGDLHNAIAYAEQAAADSQVAADHLWLGRLLAQDGKAQAALSAFRRAVELSPADEQARLALMRQLLAAGMRDEAEAEIRRMKLLLPPQRVDSTLGIAYEMIGETLQARLHFEQAAAARPDEPLAWRDLAAFHLLSGDNERALFYVDKLLELNEDEQPDAAEHFAWARRTKAKVIGASGRYEDYRQAVALLRANAQGKTMPEADLLALAELTLPRDDPYALQDAVGDFTAARRQRKLSIPAQLALARLHAAAGAWSACEEIMTSLVAQAGDDREVLTRWCELRLDHGKADRLEPLVRRLSQNAPRTRRIRARLYAQQGRRQRAVEVAREAFSSARSKAPEQAALQIARFLEDLELQDEAERYYRAAADANPQLRLQLAEFLARSGELEQAFAICDGQLSDQTVIPITRIGILALTAKGETIRPDAPHAATVLRWLEKGLREFPDSKALQLNQLFYDELLGNYDRATAGYRAYLSRSDLTFRERAIAANNLAMILASQGECARARHWIEEAIALVGPTVAILDTRAMVALCSGEAADTTRAVEDLKMALAVADEPAIRFHLALALQQAGDASGAEKALRAALDGGLNAQKLSQLDRPRYKTLLKFLGIERQSRRGLQLGGPRIR